MISINYTRRRRTLQEHDFYGQQLVPIDSFLKNPEQIIQSMRPAALNALNQLLFFAGVHKKVFYSQATIGIKMGGYCRETVNRSLKVLEDLGLVSRNYRHKKSNEYRITDYFRNPFNRARLMSLLPALKFLPIILLMVPASRLAKEEKVTQDSFEYFINSLSPSVCLSVLDKVTNSDSLSTKKIGGRTEKKKEEKKMSSDNPIRERIRNLKQLNLSKWGQMKLMAFPDEAIDYAEGKLKNFTPKEQFGWFFKVCLEFCKDNKIAPDWSLIDTMLTQYKCPANAAMTLGPMTVTYSKPIQQQVIPSRAPAEYEQQKQKQKLDYEAKEAKRAEDLAQDQADPLAAARKIEEFLHGSDGRTAKSMWTPKRYNPWLVSLDRDQQQNLIDEVHAKCSCSKEFISQPWEKTDLNAAKREAFAPIVDNFDAREYVQSKGNEDCWPDGSPMSREDEGSGTVWE